MKRLFKNLLVFCIIALVLVASFWWGENSSPVPVENMISQPQITAENYEEPMHTETEEKEERVPEAEVSAPDVKSEPAGVSAQKTESSAEKSVLPEKNANQDRTQAEEKLVCSFSVSCNTALANIDRLVPEKQSLIPSDGVLHKREAVVFNEGDTVFDLLLRETTAAGIHMEFVKTPVYGNVYIEGIGNLYEFDCGELSGWMYRVNGVFPNFGCDGYKLKTGDEVEWVYTCNLGRDVGGDYFAQNGN